MKHPRLTGTAALLTAVALTAACSGGGDAGGESATGTGPITIWLSNNEQEVAWGEALVEQWNAEHPDEQVTAQ
jgi:multiple sugar transport system substrate-binding protein